MTDVFTPNKRSQVMSNIRGRGNRRTELAMVQLLRRHHITGWRRHPPMFGRPDFIFRGPRMALFVDGCFWHGCPHHSTVPATHRGFWLNKLEGNRRRDRLVNRMLRAMGWRVLRVWEHELKPKRESALVRRIQCALSQPPPD
ncbi:MAG: DNA mismatch endonuclease Vsr [Phycisphaerales bacterium]|jgi:DNA mismatch endonuclease (patch repair protein)|nr:DNA mismatch endonuclease Vsr [Phycisphaerales bacterium]